MPKERYPKQYQDLWKFNPPKLGLGLTPGGADIVDSTYRKYDYSPGEPVPNMPFTYQGPENSLSWMETENETDDLLPEEKEAFELLLSRISEQNLDTFIDRINKYRRLKKMQAQAQGPKQI